MSDEGEQSKGALERALDRLMEGGLPEVIAGPAGKAISRLIGAGADIPAAWLEQKAQSIRDETKAKSKIMEVLTQESAAIGAKNPELLERGLNNLLGKTYREQENREAVAKLTIEHLRDEPPPSDSSGPSDDWLNIFEDRAAKASSDELRSLFSRILAGEIRKPGSFSLGALHMLSILDKNSAALIEKVAPYVITKSAVLKDAIPEQVTVTDLVALESIGFLTGANGFLSIEIRCDSTGQVQLLEGDWLLRMTYEPNQKPALPAYPVSQSGRELLAILSVGVDQERILRAIWKSNPKAIDQIMPLPGQPGRGIPISIKRPNI